jgi:hypothetical protein
MLEELKEHAIVLYKTSECGQRQRLAVSLRSCRG